MPSFLIVWDHRFQKPNGTIKNLLNTYCIPRTAQNALFMWMTVYSSQPFEVGGIPFYK